MKIRADAEAQASWVSRPLPYRNPNNPGSIYAFDWRKLVVHVVRAGKPDEATLDNLMQLYLHDFSEIDGGLISADLRRKWIVFRFEFAGPDGNGGIGSPSPVSS